MYKILLSLKLIHDVRAGASAGAVPIETLTDISTIIVSI